MNQNRITYHSPMMRLLQCAIALLFLGFLCLQTFYFPVLWKEAPAAPASTAFTDMETPGEFHMIEGSLPVDGDCQSALLTVLGARPLYSTVPSREDSSIQASAGGDAVSEGPVWQNLQNSLESMTSSYEGTWAVYVKNLATGETISINDAPMEAASLIKLYIMGAVMEQIQDGRLELTDEIRDLLNEMITVSDNEAANELVRYLDENHNHEAGMEQVNRFIESHGYQNTRQYNGLEDSNLWYSSQVNQTSVGDCGRFLEEIYQGSLVSHLASREMESLLMDQDITYKIPAALPDEAVSASKTGEVSGTENDTAIVYSKGGDFILCIMSSDWSSQDVAVGHIHEITETVYGYFNPEPSAAETEDSQNTEEE